MIPRKKSVVVLLFISLRLFSQDIKGAYIQSSWVPTFTYTYAYNFTVTLLTDAAMNLSRPTVSLNFGDLTSGTLSLSTSNVVDGVGVKTYAGTHTYPGSTSLPSYYPVSFLDTFRIAGIKNMGNSQTQQILASSKIYANNLSWTNTSCSVTNFPPRLNVSGNLVSYDPKVTYMEGDSISFSLVNCYSTTSYYIPNNVILDAYTGVLSFLKDSIGIYAFCLTIKEWEKNTNGIYQIARVTQVDFVLDIDQTVGLSKLETKTSNAIAYPNPTNKGFNLELQSEILSKTSIKVFNPTGQLIYEQEVKDKNTLINSDSWSTGLHLIIVSDAQSQRTFKLIKN